MQELTLVGVHEDGEHLVLEGPPGQRYLVRVDEALRVAVRRDRARLGQLQIQMDGRLRPREIQARIRSGQSAEEVAEAAGVPVDHVRRYEGPVLAEREFVVRQARAVRVRRQGSPAGAAAPTLEELVHQRLAAREVDESATAWDAWRTDDGTWVVALRFTAANRDRQARWAYDVQLRHVSPLEDEARWLTEDEPVEPAPAPRRLAPVRAGRVDGTADDEAGADGARRDGVQDRVYDVEADGGVRTVEEERALDPAAAATAATVDLLDTLRERRGRRQRITLPDDEAVHGGHGHDGAGAEPERQDALDAALDGLRARADSLGEPPAAHPPRSRPELAQDAELLVLPDADDLVPAGRPEQPSRRKGRPGQPASGRERVDHPSFGAPATAVPAAPAPQASPAPAPARTPSPAPSSAPSSAPPGSSPASRKAPVRSARTASPAPSVADDRGGRAQEPATEAPAGHDDDVPLPSRRARRASVPSWDDIVFGSRRE